MPQKENLLEQILSGRSDANINFNDLPRLMDRLGFQGEFEAATIFLLEIKSKTY